MSLETSLELNVIKDQIAGLCAFSLGKEMIENLHPSYDPLIIRRDNARIREALEMDIHYGPMPFGGIRDIRTVLTRAEKGMTLTANEILMEIHAVNAIRQIHSYEAQCDTNHPEMKDLTASLTVHDKLSKELSACINEYGEVMDSASAKLRDIRIREKNADADISAAVSRFMSAHPDSIVDSIVTYRGGRAVVLVRSSEKNAFGGLVYGDSASGQASYIEPASIVSANNRRQQLLSEEAEEVSRILQECSRKIGAVSGEEIANIETCGLLDSLFARAEWGKAHDGCAAVLSQKREIALKKARHPLIDPKKVVSNDYNLADPKRVLLITGPNTGGKTVSMKIIGLFVLMTYCGIPVTCDSAVIPFFDHVFADIGDDQSVVSSLSSFSAHIVKEADALKHATKDSLVLLDEIGNGTDPKEGESLAIAVLNELRQRGTMTVATTHYSRLKAYGKRHDDILLASVAFDMEKLEPTYKYVEGITGSSNALEVAQRYGLPKSVVSYARFLMNQAKSEEDQLIDRLEEQLNASVKKNEELDEKLKEISAYQKQIETEKINLEKEKDEYHAKAQAEADAYVEEAKQKADAILKKMRRMQANAKYHEVLAERQKLNRQEEAADDPSEKHEDTDFRVGDTVELRSTSQAAVITAVKRKDITISLNGREMHVKAAQIRPSLKIIPKVKPQQSVAVSTSDLFSSISSECNLIGMHVDEAMDTMADYIDSAKVHHLRSFRIIHGDGSGALRKAVHAALAKDPDVKEFRLGMPNEGGSGATVVTLK